MSARCEPPIAPDYLDALVAEVAALRAERSRAMKVEVSGELLGTAMRAWVDSCGDLRATLAAVIPAIQNAALERAAVDVEQWAAAVEAKAPASPTIIQAHMHAAAIRALKETT